MAQHPDWVDFLLFCIFSLFSGFLLSLLAFSHVLLLFFCSAFVHFFHSFTFLVPVRSAILNVLVWYRTFWIFCSAFANFFHSFTFLVPVRSAILNVLVWYRTSKFCRVGGRRYIRARRFAQCRKPKVDIQARKTSFCKWKRKKNEREKVPKKSNVDQRWIRTHELLMPSFARKLLGLTSSIYKRKYFSKRTLRVSWRKNSWKNVE